ncbi:hypothetical protein RJZ57_008424 [Blastomyces gilchristii]
MRISFGYADKGIVQELFHSIYGISNDNSSQALSSEFVNHIPEGKFTAAEIQGYLLLVHRMSPKDAGV